MVDNFDEKMFEDLVTKEFNSFETKMSQTLTVAVVGKVSSGKSSFLNAFFDSKRTNPKFVSGAEAGITTSSEPINIGDFIKVIDTPGLSDITKSNSNKTKELLKNGIDIGILVVAGAIDQDQKNIYEEIKQNCKYIFIVLNKIDIESRENVKKLKIQWAKLLSINEEQIHCVSSRGYAPSDRIIDPVSGEEKDIPIDDFGIPKTLRGIKELRDLVLDKCVDMSKELFLEQQLQDKSSGAAKIIALVCASAMVASFVPGSAFTISGIQTVAIASLHFLYKGNVLSKTSALSILPIFIAQNIGGAVFLFFKSFLPPTGILDLAAALISVSITAAMLITISNFYKNNIKIEKRPEVNKMFNDLKVQIKEDIKNISLSDLKDKNFWSSFIKKYL